MRHWDWYDPENRSISVHPDRRELEIETLWSRRLCDETCPELRCTVSVFHRDECLFCVEATAPQAELCDHMAANVRQEAINRAMSGNWQQGGRYSV